MILDEKLSHELQALHGELYDAGKLLSRDKLAQYYSTFRERFGPQRLQNLDGEALLEALHDLSNSDSLGYWLEFKNDEEFPAAFGSIAGGSALKFGIYRRKETGVWMTGSPQKQVELSLEEAVQIARKHRDQLLRGDELLDKLPSNGADEDYIRLQGQLENVAPDVYDTAWGHKYFSLLYPHKLDNYHVEHYQRFHLTKLLQLLPEGKGRYLAAGRYVAIAQELDIPMNHLHGVLNHRNGRPHRYWRVLANYPDTEGFENNWELMRDGGYIAIGWSGLGDLSDIQYDQPSKKRVQELMKAHYRDPGKWASQVFSFVATMEEGDVVLAFERSKVLGIGRVSGPYEYTPSTPRIPHHRAVVWCSKEEWELPTEEAKGSTVRDLRLPANLVEIERRILGAPSVKPPPPRPPVGTTPRLDGVPGRVQSVLERKRQVILYGPPGTGKTYWARIAAQELASYGSFGQSFSELSPERKRNVWQGDGSAALVWMCTFHPAYGYEDFIEGYRPREVNGQLVFERQDGAFKKLCDVASQRPGQRFYLIIDEINRGDIPRIFGELLTLLEKDKRGQAVLLPLSGDSFQVPDNVYVIGTMNTADRSIALLDTALRRRFGFIELMPDTKVLTGAVVANSIPLGLWLDALNERILEHIGRDARNLQIGHAYLLEDGRPVTDFARFARIVQDDILPLLEEYCYEDYAALEKILGNELVDVNRQRIDYDLFSPARRDDLIRALLARSPDLSASSQAVTYETVQSEEDGGGDDGQGSEGDPPA